MKKLNITDIYVIMLHRYTVCSVASSKLLGPMLKFEMRKSFLLVVSQDKSKPERWQTAQMDLLWLIILPIQKVLNIQRY